MRKFTQVQADRHNAITAKGWALTKGRLVLQGEEPTGPPGWFERWQLRRALQCFERALVINPEGWSAMWALGKIHQRLGYQEAAFEWFVKAHTFNPEQPDVAREAGIAAFDLGRAADALALCRTAVACEPDDPGLVCNLALTLCLIGNDAEAVRCVSAAAERDPTDVVTKVVHHFIGEVAAGTRPRPQSLQEVFPR
jgi:tetratricopeptide (TPR) repeat protein